MVLLHVGFGLTGAYTTLLGSVLPVLEARWGLHDSRAGALLLAQFLGSTLGAFVRGGRLASTIAMGFAAVGASCCALAVLPDGVRSVLPMVVLLVYGVGLGTAMTSTSVWMGMRFTRKGGSALESLNAVWALGAGITPWVVLPWAEVATLARFLEWFSVPAGLMGCAVFVLGRREAASAVQMPAEGLVRRDDVWRVGVLLGLLSFASVGAESALGGWMSTYVHRADVARTATQMAAHGVAGDGRLASAHSMGASSGFWIGLLGGRVAASVLLLGGAAPVGVALGSIAVGCVAIVLLLTAHASGWMVALAVLCGVGIGPLYPLVLAYALRWLRGRWIFVLAGLGSAVVPWGTGLLSTRFHTLDVGLTLPLGLMVVMGVAVVGGRGLLGRDGDAGG